MLRTITGKLTDLKRMESSVNGNPRYSALVAGEYVQTSIDSAHGYSLPNYEGLTITVEVKDYKRWKTTIKRIID